MDEQTSRGGPELTRQAARQQRAGPGLAVRIEAIRPGSPIERGEVFTFEVDGKAVEARAGETIAVALLARGQRRLRSTRKQGKPRGLFCAMGICFDCVVTVDGRSGVRACMTTARPGTRVERPGQSPEDL